MTVKELIKIKWDEVGKQWLFPFSPSTRTGRQLLKSASGSSDQLEKEKKNHLKSV